MAQQPRIAPAQPINAAEKWDKLGGMAGLLSGSNALLLAGGVAAACVGGVLYAALAPSGRRHQLAQMRKFTQCQFKWGNKLFCSHGLTADEERAIEAQAHTELQALLSRTFKAYDTGVEDAGLGDPRSRGLRLDGAGEKAGDNTLCRGEAMLFFEDYFRCLCENPDFVAQMVVDIQKFLKQVQKQEQSQASSRQAQEARQGGKQEGGSSSVGLERSLTSYGPLYVRGQDMNSFFIAEDAEALRLLEAAEDVLARQAQQHQSVARPGVGVARQGYAIENVHRRRQEFVQRLFQRSKYRFTDIWFRFCDKNDSGDLDEGEVSNALIGEQMDHFSSVTEEILKEALGCTTKKDVEAALALSREPTGVLMWREPSAGASGLPRCNSSAGLTPFGPRTLSGPSA